MSNMQISIEKCRLSCGLPGLVVDGAQVVQKDAERGRARPDRVGLGIHGLALGVCPLRGGFLQ
jgi:hypothetical protein